MFARASTIIGSGDQLERGIAMLQGETLDALQHMEGFCGILGLVDRDAGRSLVVTLWENEKAMRDSEKEADKLRSAAARELGSSSEPHIDRYELVLHEVRTPVHA